MVRSYGELNKGLQAIVARWTEFSKRSFEDATAYLPYPCTGKNLGARNAQVFF